MIQVKHLDKYFNRGKKNSIHVLNDVSLSFPEKGLVVLLGPSGSGKTTLLNVIGGLDKVQKGEIQFFDHEIKHYKSNVWDKIRTEEVGYIFQNYYLMPNLSVFDNVAFVLKMIGINDKDEIESRVNYILKQVGMYRFRKKRSTQLSGGQQQRVAIARALVKNPKVIIADEPTGNLDSKNTLEIMNIIKSISVNKLVVLVTHEKELANFYGDRIIEIKDGQIVGDINNDSSIEHGFENENTIYLKDLDKISDLSSDNLKASFYSDSKDIQPTEIRLIIKNKTLYLDIQSDIQKVKLLNEESHIEVKDAHFTKKTREEMLQTTFDDTVLDHQALPKQKRLTISFKNSFWIAFRKIMNFGRKGKLMLAIFLISGMLVAFATINMYSILSTDYRDNLLIDERYLEVEKDSYFNTSGGANILLDRIGAATGDDYRIHINSVHVNGQLSINLGNGMYKMLPSGIKTEYAEQLTQGDLYAGSLPTNPNQIVISLGIYSTDNFMDMSYEDIGIWSANDFIGEILSFNGPLDQVDRYYEVVGISRYRYKSIYVYDYETAFLFNNFSLNEEPSTKRNFESTIIGASGNIFVFTPNYMSLKSTLETFGYDVTLSSQAAANANQVTVASQIAANTMITIFLIGGGLLAFYFVMRSSMISRIYEISVYRALGVRKYEIYSSFSVEIVLITTISSLIGYILMAIILNAVSNSPISAFVNYRVDFIIISIGILFVYLSNLIIGLLPMGLLLRKTPSQIISSYDI